MSYSHAHFYRLVKENTEKNIKRYNLYDEHTMYILS